MLLESTNGPVEHAQIACLVKHIFLMPTASLVRSDSGVDLPDN